MIILEKAVEGDVRRKRLIEIALGVMSHDLFVSAKNAQIFYSHVC